MLNERWNKILDLLDERGSLNLKELMEHCNVSEATIRRDLTNLEDKNLLYRTHGGAMKRSAARGSEESVLYNKFLSSRFVRSRLIVARR